MHMLGVGQFGGVYTYRFVIFLIILFHTKQCCTYFKQYLSVIYLIAEVKTKDVATCISCVIEIKQLEYLILLVGW